MTSPKGGGEGGLAKRWHWMTWGRGGGLEGANFGWCHLWTAPNEEQNNLGDKIPNLLDL